MPSSIPKDKFKRYEALRIEIERHNRLYYIDDSPNISDAEFDRLFDELIALEKAHPGLESEDSPSRRVGAPPAGSFKKVSHRKRMLSLQKVVDEDEFAEFDRRAREGLFGKDDENLERKLEYFVEPKLDGLAVELVYNNGKLTLGSTRGDGSVGENITANLRTILSIPLRLTDSFAQDWPLLEVRGEVFMRLSDFKKINKFLEKEGSQPLANPRNGAAGSLRQLDSAVTAGRPLRFCAYGCLSDDDSFREKYPSQSEIMKFLSRVGFAVNELSRKASGANEINAAFKKLEKKRAGLDYEIDGMVVKVNSLADQTKIGEISRAPRWATAWKFAAKETLTILENIIFSVGRTGTITPVAVMKPVSVGGVTVTNASLHNEDELETLDIRIGDHILVRRAGDVIPEVREVIFEKRTGKEKKVKFPRKCPSCASLIERLKGEAAYRCRNPKCPAQLAARIFHFASKGGFDIDGLGEKLADQLVERELAQNPADLFELTRDDLLPLDLMAEKRASNLLEAIESSKSRPLDRALFALGIDGVGETAAGALAQRFQSIEALIDADEDELVAVDGIGTLIAKSVVEFFSSKTVQNSISKMRRAGVLFEFKEPRKSSAKLDRKAFVVTGTLSKPRDYFKGLIKENGGVVQSSLSSKTNFLLVGEKPGSKLEKAKKLNVEIIDEKSFFEML